jgi:hypothetical protein
MPSKNETTPPDPASRRRGPERKKRGKCPECHKRLGNKLTTHPQVPLSYAGRHAHVDEGLFELLETCWQLGIWTAGSCQGTPGCGGGEVGSADIALENGTAAENFCFAVTVPDWPAMYFDELPEGALGWRMREVRAPGDPGAWVWGISAEGTSPERFEVGFYVHFPPADIPEITRRLKSVPRG